MSVFKSPKFILRAVEWLFAIVAFGCAADFASAKLSQIGFMIFTGVTAFLLDMFFMLAYAKSSLNSKIVGTPELAVSAIWTLFFFAASTAMAAYSNKDQWSSISNFNASIVFGYLSFVLWGISSFFSFRDRQGRGSAASHV